MLSFLRKFLSLLVISYLPTLLLFYCASNNLRQEARFSYQNVYREKYELGQGGIIPLTLERGESFSGSISPDGKYLYFSSNRLGNYDLFLRPLDDVEIIPIVKTVTNQREPTISPDGKKIAYIDDELDPDGDLVVLRVKPKDIIKKYVAGENPQEGIFGSKPKVLTNDEVRRVRSREMNPAWSPDGKFIAFSSDMTSPMGNPFGPGVGAIQNIWLMDPDKPSSARKLTEKGGVMPSFSPDGQKMVYVSYQDSNSNGDIYELDLATLESRQITSGNALDINPAYSPDGKAIIFSRIARDTNGDNQIDRKDKAQLFFLPLQESLPTANAYPLTTSEESTFDSRVSGFVNGSIVFAFVSGENINVAFIPTTGIIPRKNTIQEQLSFAAQFKPKPNDTSTKAHEEYVMALRVVTLFHATDPLAPVLANQAQLELYQYLAQRNDPQAIIEKQKIENLAKNQEPYLGVLVDLERLNRNPNPLPATAPLLATTDKEAYLNKVASLEILKAAYSNPEQDPKNLKLRNIEADLKDKLAQHYRSLGREEQARKLERQILYEHPEYYRAHEILYQQAQFELSEVISPTALFFLYPDKYPWFNEKDGPDFVAKNNLLANNLSLEYKEKIKLLIYQYFYESSVKRQQALIRALLERHSQEQYPELNYLAGLAMAMVAVERGESLQTEQLLPAEKSLPANSRWLHLYYRIWGQLHELRNNPDEAFNSYYIAFLNYQKDFAIANTRSLLQRTLNYYRERAQENKNRGNFREAWRYYQILAQLELQLQARNIESDLVEQSAIETLVAINEMTFAEPKEDSKFLKQVQKFYDNNMDFARRYLVNSFIFGRAHLNVQQGILRHERFEKDGLGHSEKKEVLQLFKLAEQDFKWSFFADPLFPDSYVMLGWMYQFIDTKREKIVDIANNTKDKDKFDSLYRAYFPNYLFEENIRIYQKSIELLKDKVNPRILLSFHLNMGNNYFLLNNYAKAEEHYAVVSAAVAKKEYSFESKTQQALFHYHAGRTWYFTGKYNKAGEELRNALELYRELAPLDNVSPKQREFNRSRRETIMRQLALNADLNNKPEEAINWYQEILAEQKYTATYHDRSFIFLELARLHYDKKDYDQAFVYLREASAALGAEREILPPRFKIRIKWLGFYEPWTTIMSWLYQLPYDNVYVGENRLVFPLPTVNRYQYLYSLEAELYRQKGLYSQAKAALIKLQDYARKDKSKHGRETLLAAHMRLGEIEYLSNNFTLARQQYKKAIELASENSDFVALQKAEKNLLTIAAKEIETLPETIEEKIKRTEKELKTLEKFTENYLKERLKAEEEALKEKNPKLKLTAVEKAKIRLEALKEIYKLAIYKGVFHFYLAELKESKLRANEKPVLELASYLRERAEIQAHFTTAYRLFQGLVADPENPEKDTSFLERRDNGMRLALTLNRGRLLQTFQVQNLAASEYQLAYDRAEEFQAFRLKALAAYRVFETTKDYKFLMEAYRLFMEYPHLAAEYPLLFEQISEVRIGRYLERQEFAAAIQAEDLKRFILAREVYRGKIGFFDKVLQQKYEEHTQLYNMEVARMKLIETLRLARENSDFWEAELTRIRTDRLKLEQEMLTMRGAGQLGPVFYRTESLENQILPLVYILENQGQTQFLLVDKRTFTVRGKVSSEIFYQHKNFYISEEELQKTKGNLNAGATESAWPVWLLWLRETKARQVITDRRFQDFPLEKIFNQPVWLDLSLPSARLFARNHNVSRRRLVQITNTGGFWAFGGNNAVKYPIEIEQQLVSSLEQWQNTATGYSVLDYEAQLASGALAIDRSEVPFYAIMQTNMFPSLVIVHSTREQGLQPSAEFYYRTAINLLSASKGATAVVYLEGNRKANAAKMPIILSDKITDPSVVILGAGVARNYLKTGEKTAELVQLATAERARELARINEPSKLPLNALLSRAERARDAEQLMNTQTTFIESDELFHLRTSLLLRLGYLEAALKDWKNRETLLSQTGQEKKIPAAFVQMLSRMFVWGFREAAMEELRKMNLAPVLEAKDWQNLLEAYHLSSLIQGDIEVFYQEPPADFSRAEREFAIKLPTGVAARVAFFTQNSQYLEEWQEALYTNLEFKEAYALQKRQAKNASEHRYFYQAYIYQELVDPNYSPSWAANWLSEIKKVSLSKPAIAQTREEALRSDFVQLSNFLRNGNVSQAIEFAKQQLVDPTSSREVQDAALFIFLKNLWKREFTPDKEKLILEYLAFAGNLLQKTETNRQRKAFYEILKIAPALSEGPEKLLQVAQKAGVSMLSSGNQSVLNRLAYFASTWQPQKGAAFSFFQVEELLEDAQLNQRIRYLRLLGDSQGERYLVENHWQMALNFDYLRLTNKPEQALLSYLKYDRGLTKLPQATTLPLQGLISTYPGIDLKFTVSSQKVTLKQTYITDQPSFLSEFAALPESYLYLPRKQNYLIERKLSWQPGTILFLGEGAIDWQERQGWQGDSQDSALQALLRIYLGQQSKNPLYSLTQNPQNTTTAPVRLYQQAQKLQNIATKLPASSSYHLVLLDETKRTIYLTFLELLLQEMKQPNTTVETAFLAAQKKLAQIYPLVQDQLSVVLVRS